MPFANQVTAGVQFVRKIMQSLGFVPGVSGWQLKRNGDAQFNNVTLTGTFAGTNYVINTSGTFFYSGIPAAGNLIVSDTTASGTDGFGNAYLAGTTGYIKLSGVLWEAVQTGTVQGLAFYSAPSYAGPWTETGAIQTANGDVILVPNRYGNIQAPLALINQGSDASALTGYTLAYALAGHLKYAGTDGNVYDTGQATLYKTAAQTISTTGAAAVTFANGGPTVAVAAGTYRIRFYGSYLENQAAGTPSFELTGPATSNVEVLTRIYSIAGAASVLTNRTTALGAPFTGPVMTGVTRIIDLEGLIVFTAAGSLGLSALTSAGADTYNLQAGSFLELVPVA